MADPVIKFTGHPTAGFHHGIPARDLSGAEYDALDTEQRAIVRASPAYDYAAYRDAAKKQRDRADAKEAKAVAVVAEAEATAIPAEDVTPGEIAPMYGVIDDARPS